MGRRVFRRVLERGVAVAISADIRLVRTARDGCITVRGVSNETDVRTIMDLLVSSHLGHPYSLKCANTPCDWSIGVPRSSPRWISKTTSLPGFEFISFCKKLRNPIHEDQKE